MLGRQSLAGTGWVGGDLPALVLLRAGLNVEDRILLKIKVPKAVLGRWWML